MTTVPTPVIPVFPPLSGTVLLVFLLQIFYEVK